MDGVTVSVQHRHGTMDGGSSNVQTFGIMQALKTGAFARFFRLSLLPAPPYSRTEPRRFKPTP